MSGFEIGTDGPQRIMVGIDGSDTSLRAVAYAWGLARRQGSQLVFVFAATSNTITSFVPDATASAIMAGHEVAADLRERVAKVSETIHPAVPYVFRVEHGDAAGVLIRVADEVRADAVVVGASVQAGHRIMGSVAIRLVRAGRWPVTVVP
ncbi:universal stress protein [Planotetraspora kaengkrachanensis]|uniref:Universal stress protein A n=1 Tax=Planotetraspora kaengkrachanensis TaxID=575193 RepID=A0A8J3PYT6_9ACTN|nr:universal stress protein [Planotetraspora kaengkrachanensis]GIG83527.1 universal stress protein A [Planotetraspora kaengkrachanensis]